MNYRNIEVNQLDGYIATTGLTKVISFEIRLKSFGSDGEYNLLIFIIDYILDKNPKIKNDDTIAYGLWLLKFVFRNEYYEIFELDDLFREWQEGADNAIYYLDQQKIVCKNELAQFSVPLFTQKLAVSEGVLEGKAVQGIRYSEPDQMSGWYLTTSQYNGNINNLQVIEFQTLVIYRKDLLQFMALPPGFVFETTDVGTCKIWKAPLDANVN